MTKQQINVINGIEVYNNEVLTLSVNGKIVLYADARHFEKLAKKVMRQEGIADVSKWYNTLINTGRVNNIAIDSIFINEIIDN